MSNDKVKVEKTDKGFKVSILEQPPTVEEMQAQTLLNTELLLIYKEIGM